MTSMLLVDIGNSRIKWTLDQDDVFTVQGSHTHDEAEQFAMALGNLALPDLIIASNVAGEKGRKALEMASAQWKLSPEWIQASRQACGVRNCYEEPERLGPDRWAALIAAYAMQLGECLVISSGTALTVDWLHANGEHAGGMILPGKALMREALGRGTEMVGYRHGKVAGFACNTADAVESGLALALAGAVIEARQRIIEITASPPACLITGGDGEWLRNMLGFPAIAVPDLVLRGLALIGSRDS